MKHTLVNARVRVEMKIVASVLFISVYQKVGCGVEASCVDSYCDVFVQLFIFLFYIPGPFFYQCLCLCSEATTGYS